MNPETQEMLRAAEEAVSRLIEQCQRTGPLYQKCPRAVAQVSRTGKWLGNAACRIEQAQRAAQSQVALSTPVSLFPASHPGGTFMTYLAALLIFLLVTTVTWFVAIALYQMLVGGPDLREKPHFAAISWLSIILVTLDSFVPFPLGYLLSLVMWWLAAKIGLELSMLRAVLLFAILATLSFISPLALLGALSF